MSPIQASTPDARDSSSESTHLQLCALRLPNELIDIIFGFLDEEMQVCFALTCQTFYSNYFLKTSEYYRRSKNRYWIRDLLYQLEKDSPDYYYCVQCDQLRRWDVPPQQDWSGWKQWKGYLGHQHCQDDDYFKFPVGEDHCLTLHAVRVVMNRHLYGPLHGIPLQEIELDTHKPCPETGASVDMSMRPRIIDDELFLSVRYKIFHPQEDAESLEDFIDYTKWRVCRHLQIGDYWARDNCWAVRKIDFLPHRIPELEIGRCPLQNCSGEFGNVRSCQVCMTDYQVKISRQYDGQEKRGWTIEIAVWHQLGNGRNPLGGGPWFRLACEGYPGGLCRESPPGIVRHRWSKGDSTLLDIEGEFVEGMDELPEGLTTDREGNVVLEGYEDYW